jgi:hypothetical protein
MIMIMIINSSSLLNNDNVFIKELELQQDVSQIPSRVSREQGKERTDLNVSFKKCETKAEDQWRRANTGIVCMLHSTSMPSMKRFLAESLTVPSCSNKNSKLFPSPTCMPDLEMKNAKLRARPCMYASATAEMPGCSRPGKQYGSNIPQDHWKTKPSTSAERERSIEKYREVL